MRIDLESAFYSPWVYTTRHKCNVCDYELVYIFFFNFIFSETSYYLSKFPWRIVIQELTFQREKFTKHLYRSFSLSVEN